MARTPSGSEARGEKPHVLPLIRQGASRWVCTESGQGQVCLVTGQVPGTGTGRGGCRDMEGKDSPCFGAWNHSQGGTTATGDRD